ncbi:MAG: hypothetical protein HQ536_00505 [Parcubacteria group bacterium]|nr:hypothetical protein [Parcubacteria group bacterium]
MGRVGRKPLRVEFPAGVEIRKAMREMISKAKEGHATVVANINDIDIYADHDSSAIDLLRYYWKVREMVGYMEENGLDVSRFLTDEPCK